MATCRRADIYFPNQGQDMYCGLCRALSPPQVHQDDAAHWVSCPVLMPVWEQEIHKAVIAKQLPTNDTFQCICLEQREPLVWGLVPDCVSVGDRAKVGCVFTSLARVV